MKKRNIVAIVAVILLLPIVLSTVSYYKNRVFTRGQEKQIIESTLDLSEEKLLEKGWRLHPVDDGSYNYVLDKELGFDHTTFLEVDSALSQEERSQLKVEKVVDTLVDSKENGTKSISIYGQNDSFDIIISINDTERKTEDAWILVSYIIGLDE